MITQRGYRPLNLLHGIKIYLKNQNGIETPQIIRYTKNRSKKV